jgi:hypothetical protein
MSHFTVLVIGDNVEEQLEPYNENIKVEAYKEGCYCARNRKYKYVNKKLKDEGLNVDTYREKFQKIPEDDKPEWRVFIKEIIDRDKELTESEEVAKIGPDPECEACHGTGLRKTTRNPNGKWDWYSIGGRWSGFFKVKAGKTGKLGRPGVFGNEPGEGYVDQIRKGDIDFIGMYEDQEKELKERYDEAVSEYKAGKSKCDIEFMWGVDLKTPKDEFVEKCMSKNIIMTFAVVKDGKWYERGEMGFWAVVTNEKESDVWETEFVKLIEGLPDDTLLTVVDCHI